MVTPGVTAGQTSAACRKICRVLTRGLDRLFGFDFFVSYSHADGKLYPRRLATALVERGFSVFLDEKVYVAGEELSAVTERRIAQSRRLIVVCASGAVRSKWVRREVEIFSTRAGHPLVIERDETLQNDPEAAWLRDLLRDTLTLRDFVAGSDDPSPETIDRLVQSFQSRRLDQVRTFLFAVAAILFGILALTAWFQRSRAVTEARRAISSRLAIESRAQLERDPIRAVELARCAMESDPLLAAQESLVSAVRGTWAVEEILSVPVGSLSEALLVPATETWVAGGEAGLWTWTDGEAREITLPGPPMAEVKTLAVTADGKFLAGGIVDGSLVVLDASRLEFREIRSRLHDAGITRVVALEGSLVATVGYDSELIVSDLADLAESGRAPLFHRAGSWLLGIQDAAYDRIRRRLVTAGADGRLALWDLRIPQSPELLSAYEATASSEPGSGIWTSVGLDPVNGVVAAGDGAGRLRLFLQHEDELQPIDLSTSDRPATTDRWIQGTAFVSERLLATTHQDGTTGLWSVDQRTDEESSGFLVEARAHGGAIGRARTIAPGRLVTAGADGRLIVWRLDGTLAPIPRRATSGVQPFGVLSSDGAYIATWDDRNVVTVSATADRRIIGVVEWDPEIVIWTAAVSVDGKLLALGDERGIVTLWRLPEGTRWGGPLDIHESNVTALAFDATSSRWLLSGAMDGTVVVTRIDKGAPGPRNLAKLGGQVVSLSFAQDGSLAAAATSANGQGQLWRTDDWVSLETLELGPERLARAIAVGPHGSQVALAADRGEIALFQRREGSWERRSLIGHRGHVLRLSYSSDDGRLASGGDDGRIVIWSTADGARILTLPSAHSGLLEDLAWSSRGDEVIAIGGEAVSTWAADLQWWSRRAAELVPEPACPGSSDTSWDGS